MNYKKYVVKFYDSVIIRFVKTKGDKMSKVENAKNKETEQVPASLEEVTVAPAVNLTRFMLGTYLDPQSGEWMLAYVKFDPRTMTLGQIKTDRVAGDMEVMKERMLIKQAQLGIYDVGPVADEGNQLNIY